MRQEKILEEEISNPVIREEREVARGAKMLNDTLSEKTRSFSGKNRRRLKAQQRVARNRAIIAGVILVVLILVLMKIL